MAKKIYVRNNDNTEWIPLATSIPNASAYATYEYVDNELANIDLTSTINTASAAAVTYLVDYAPETLNTLNELSAALNDDANFASTITTSLGNKLDISSASATYLTQVNASTTYATKTELNNIDALPSQSGNTGKFLQTDGTDVSWQNVDLSSKQDYSVVLDTLGSSYISLGEGSGFLKYTRGFLGSSPTWSLDTTTYLTQTSASSSFALKNSPAFSAYASTSINIAQGETVKIGFQTEEFDTNSNYDTTLSRFTPTIAGYYQITAMVTLAVASAGIFTPFMYKNGTEFKLGATQTGSGTNFPRGYVSSLVYANGTTDYFEIFAGHSYAATVPSYAVASQTYFTAAYVRGI
jgi:hypothetical protein